MKILIIMLTIVTGVAHASEKYTEADYRRFTKDGAMRVNVEKSAKKNLNFFGASCAKAALAAVISKSYSLAEEDGVDYPETLDVTAVKAEQPVPWIKELQIKSGDLSFVVLVDPSAIPCVSDKASVR